MPPEALAAWQALVAGRYTLLEQQESDGRHLLLARVNQATAPAQGTLSAREAQVVVMVAQGQSNKQIAYRLGVSQSTASGCLKRAMVKLGVTSRAEVARQVRGRGPR